ncbi:Gfo/Idh/MocA family protein [Seongchinamella sediminis]|nr:Gfo/Idh/MocA family oxidoreductase [Seongchinamella sediminis]
MQSQALRLGLIGSGFMGRTHALAAHTAKLVFPSSAELQCELLADFDASRAAEQAALLGFRRSTGDWREVVADPRIDIVDVCTPNHLHYPMAKAALEQGKHVFCEKPLALGADESRELATLAAARGCITMVGFNYVKNPVISIAKELIDRGEIGQVRHVRGTHVEDYLADPLRDGGWRTRRSLAGLGALGDLCHILSLTQRLVGEPTEVCADFQTVIPERPDGPVENEDQMHALLRFECGAIGTIECSRIAWGRKNGLTLEISGSAGSLFFDQERQNELWLYHADGEAPQGFRRILLGNDQPDYAAFCPASGHGLGFNDLKVIEMRDLVAAVAIGAPAWPDFAAAARIDAVTAAMVESCRKGGWVNVAGAVTGNTRRDC